MHPAVIGWELLLCDEQGPGDEPGTRRYVVTAVASYDDGSQRMRLVRTEVDETPERMDAWVAQQAGRRVQ